jgi:WD40 repeat protein/serine/threonine protein kinase
MVSGLDGQLRREEQLDELIAAYLDQVEAGRTPHPDEWLERHAEFKAELATFFADRERLERFAAPMRAITQPTARVDSLGQLGDFHIVREIGRGGMGVVYEAEQISLKRRVALKVLPFAAVLDPKQVTRFKNEAQAAANLDHPHIVSVYSVGCDRGIHYYAMQYIEGQSLAEIVEELRRKDDAGCSMLDAGSNQASNIEHPASSIQKPASSPETAPIAALSTLHAPGSLLTAGNPREQFRHVAQLGIQAAEALHYAHEMGIVHRDIKPSNLLVDAQSHLLITDFGLATTQTDAGLTMTGDLLGTLRYMSPEQAAGDRASIDYRTDIYSLGITLYELLTGQPAFADTDRKLLLRHILEEDPKPLRSIDTSIPRDLETIVLKATEKESHQRYDSAAELAADLQRFCEEKPIRARRTSRTERLWRWGKRNRLVAALAFSVASLVTLVAITAPMIAWRQARLIDETRQQLYAKDLSIAYTAWNDGDLGHVRELLERYAAGSPYAHLRDFPYFYLEGLFQRGTAGFMPAEHFDVSLDAGLLAVAQPDSLVHLYNLKTWQEIGSLPWKRQALQSFRLSPDGRFLAAGYRNGTLSVWDIPARQHLYTEVADSHPLEIFSPCFSPDGSMLASGGRDKEVKIRDAATGTLLRELSGHRDAVSALDFSPDGTTLATAGSDRTLRFWDTITWKPRTIIENAFDARVWDLRYDPGGTYIVAGGYGDHVRIFDPAAKPVGSLKTDSGVGSLGFSPDGRLLAVGGETRGTVQVWNIEDKTLLKEFVVSNGSVRSVALLPSGELLIGAGSKLMRRQFAPAENIDADRQHQMRSEEIALDVSASGDILAAAYGQYETNPGEGAVVCWDLHRGTRQVLPLHDGSSVFDVAIDPAGELIMAGGGPSNGPGFVKIWNARTCELVRALPQQKVCVTGIAIAPAGGRLAVAGPGQVAVWENFVEQPKLLWKRNLTRSIRVAFAPQGDVLAVGTFRADTDWTKKGFPTVMIWDAETGEQLEIASYDRAIMDLAYSPDGRYLASIDWDGIVAVYERHERRTVLFERAHKWVGFSVAFSPDGRTLATGSSSGDIKFWNLSSMMHVTTVQTPGRVAELAFFPDGNTLAVGYLDRTVELWHLDREKEHFSIDSVPPEAR